MQEIQELFLEVKEERGRRGKIYPLPLILSAVAVSRMLGCCTILETAHFLSGLRQEHRRLLGFRDRVPCYDQLRRILHRVDSESLERALARAMERFQEQPKHLKQLCVDGKAVRASRDEEGRSRHFVSVFSPKEKITYLQKCSPPGGGEITSALELLKNVPLKHTITTGDAMFAQAELCKHIHEQGGYFLFPVKNNHPTLREELEKAFALYCWPEHLRQAHQQERTHGRWEKRSMFSMYEPFTLGEGKFTCIRHVGHLVRRRHVKRGKTTLSKGREDVYFITNLPPDPKLAEQMLHYSRTHWGIENLSHRYRDTVFKEDQHTFQNKNITAVSAALNNLALFSVQRYRQRQKLRTKKMSMLSLTRDLLTHFKQAIRFLRSLFKKK